MMKLYEKYKESGLSWIAEIPSAWELSKLKFNASLNISTVDRHELEDEIAVSVCHYPQAYNNEKINKKTVLSSGTCNEKELENFKLKKGQIIITKDSETSDDIGVPTFVEEDIPNAVCGYHLAMIDANENCIHSSYLFRYLQSKNVNYYFDTKSNGVTRFGLGKPAMENLPILIPPIEEQLRIAQYLDHHTTIIDQLIQQKEKLIELLKEKRQAVINEAVTKGLNPHAKMKDSGIDWLGKVPENWTITNLKRFAKIRNGKDQKPVQIEEGGYPVLGTGGEFGRSSEFLFDKPSVLLGRKGTIDKPQYIDVPFWTVDTLFYTDIFNDVNPKFFYFLSLSIPFHLIQESSAVPSMTQDNLNAVKLCKPSLNEQCEIVDFLNQRLFDFDIIISKSQNQIDNLKEYRQSIISEAVTGKIDVSDWQSNKLQVG